MDINTIRQLVNTAYSHARNQAELDTVEEIIKGVTATNRQALSSILNYPLEGRTIRGLTPIQQTQYKAIYTTLIHSALDRHSYQGVYQVIQEVNLGQAQSKLTLDHLILDLAEHLDNLETNALKRLGRVFNTKSTLTYTANEFIYSKVGNYASA